MSFRNKKGIIYCAANELAPRIKIHITEQIVAKSAERSVPRRFPCARGAEPFISGRPGAGKEQRLLCVCSKQVLPTAPTICILPDGGAVGCFRRRVKRVLRAAR